MLDRMLSKLIRVGRLTVHGLGPEARVFGQPVTAVPAPDVVVRIADRLTALKIALRPDPYFGEAYMDGSLTIEKGTLWDLLDLCGRNFVATAWRQPPGRFIRVAQSLLRACQQVNSRRLARRNVAHHYDLSDVLFRHFLDMDRQYSCAYFRNPKASLEEAQIAKTTHIAAKLMLRPGMRVLDIGCGWGGLALTLAKLADVQVTGITLSEEQAEVARHRAEEAGLANRVTFELQDYRDVAGRFDRIVSVGMFEHVGVPNYPVFFKTLGRLLTDDGVALLHSIGRKDGPGVTGAWTQKYIFPGGYVPALSETLKAVELTGLWVTDIEVLRLHYAETLRHWRERFMQHASLISDIYDDRFCRMWEFYLASCEMGFRYDNLMVFQVQLAKRIDAVPLVRDYMFMAESTIAAKAPETITVQ
jgi:cyclopropane-fatty-acyl-phospholipid synthase